MKTPLPESVTNPQPTPEQEKALARLALAEVFHKEPSLSSPPPSESPWKKTGEMEAACDHFSAQGGKLIRVRS